MLEKKNKNSDEKLIFVSYFSTCKIDVQDIISPSMNSKVKLATIVEGDPKAPFSIATTRRCREGRYSIPWIAPLYP